ncbi:MAG: hypothetical protein J5887_00740 [Erysipelotrichaceae bacterium]|nr:hypothetical protein [Erysipelotrichaceae bacterium]
MKVRIIGLPEGEIIKEYPEKLKAELILREVEDQLPYPAYGCRIDNAYRGLLHVVYHDCTLEFLDIRCQAMWLVYQSSLVMLYIKAVHDVLGKKVQVTVNNSLSKGLFTVIKNNSKPDEETISRIDRQMRKLVEQDLPIIKRHLNRQEITALTEELKQKETGNLIASIPSLNHVEIYSLEDETQIFYNFLVPSTGYLKYFELRPYKNGILLRYPHQSDPLKIPEYEDQKLLYDAFSEATKWGKLMGIKYVDDLNNRILNKQTEDMYLMQEALHEKKIANIADDIAKSRKRIVLICGPSSSGKTTFAKRLCIQLNVLGIKTLYMGTDDYFVEREDSPIGPDGEKDFESIKAVDTKLFVRQMKELLDGKTVDLPVFDFISGTKIYGQRITSIAKDQVIVIEGIHALNRTLTEGIDEKEKFKIYISPFTPISVDRHNRISTTDCRLLRRLVRDYQFRGWPVARTLASWPKVRSGEDQNIFPYHGEAKVFFNSNCIYELAVLKKYVEPLLKEVTRSEPEYAEAQRLLEFFRYIEPVEDDDAIANNSIIREFIGGSVIVH